MTDISETIRDHFAVVFLVIALLCAGVDSIHFGTPVPQATLA